MLIIREYTINIDIIKPDDQYSDLDEFTKFYINDNYIGRNYMSSLLIELIEVTRRSNAVQLHTSLQAIAQMCVTFKARALIYDPGEHLVIKITNITLNIVNGIDGLAQVNIPQIPADLKLKRGQFIPVVIIRSIYEPQKTNVVIIAEIYQPKNVARKSLLAYSINQVDPSWTEQFKRTQFWNIINAAEKRYAALHADRRAYFEEMSLYRSNSTVEKSSDLHEFNLSDCAIKHHTFGGFRPLVLSDKEENIIEKFPTCTVDRNKSPMQVYTIFFGDYLWHLTFIEKMCDVYSDITVFQDHKSLWEWYAAIEK